MYKKNFLNVETPFSHKYIVNLSEKIFKVSFSIFQFLPPMFQQTLPQRINSSEKFFKTYPPFCKDISSRKVGDDKFKRQTFEIHARISLYPRGSARISSNAKTIISYLLFEYTVLILTDKFTVLTAAICLYTYIYIYMCARASVYCWPSSGQVDTVPIIA